MTREKKPVHKVQMTEGKCSIIRQPLEEYDIESARIFSMTCPAAPSKK